MINKTYNYGPFKNIYNQKINNNRLIMVDVKDIKEVDKSKKEIFKLDNLNKSNESNCFLHCLYLNSGKNMYF